MKKLLLAPLLILGGLIAKAQTGGYIQYKPLKNTDSQRNDEYDHTSATITTAYYIDQNSDMPVKVRIKIIENNYGIFIVGYKRLTDESFADLTSQPIKVTKIPVNSEMAGLYEYSAYVFLRTIYF